MIPKPLGEITESDILQLKAAGRQEGRSIEYKRDLGAVRDEEKREFLADVSSFSNTDGGDLIYGVTEEQGVIADIVGLSCQDFDAETLRLGNLIRDGIAPRIRVGFRPVLCSTGRVLVIRVEKSWSGPHRVVFRGHDKFYARTDAGKFSLDVSQLRAAFLQSSTVSQQITGFRLDRLVEVSNGSGPVSLLPGPTVILHIVPLGALAEQDHFDVAQFARNTARHRLWQTSTGWSSRMTFDGAVVYNIPNEEGRVSSYAHFYRNGILEAVATTLLGAHSGEQRLIPHGLLEEELLSYLPTCFESLVDIGVRTPVSVMLTLAGVQGLQMAMPRSSHSRSQPVREPNLLLPPAIVEDFGTPAGSILRPMFDRIWNACGQLRSPNFDDHGSWVSPRW